MTATSIGKVWSLRISIPNALNIGLSFNQFNLSPSAEMYVFNDARTVLDSAIKKADFTNSAMVNISSITGSGIIIYIVEKNNFSTFLSTISIPKLIAGYQDISEVGGIPSNPLARPSVNCDPLIQCQPDKIPLARAVARMITQITPTQAGFCTGTLINNEANNGRAYFLTAFHCIDINKNKIIEQSEIDLLASTVFQFRFWRTECNGSINSSGLEFCGATLKAASQNTDVALLELSNPPGIGDLVNYAGWNRQTVSPGDNNSLIIHHPRTQDMRITSTSSVKSWFWNSNFWSAHYYSGTVDIGSSGSALLSPAGLIVGQLRGGWSSCNFTNFGDRYGKFDKSWSGAGLQTWLSPTQALQLTGLLNLTDIAINGPSTVGCTIPGNFSTLPNLLDVTYQWTVTAGIQINSGQGTSSVNISSTSSSVTSGTLTLTLRSPSKGKTKFYIVTKQISFGVPSLSLTSTAGACSGGYQTWNIVNNTPSYGSNWNWTVGSLGTNSQITIFNPTSPGTQVSVKGAGSVKLTYTDLCGGAQQDGVTVYSSCPPSFLVAPNPTTDNITVSTDAGLNNTAAAKNTAVSLIYKIKITDRLATVRKLFDYKVPVQSVSISTSGLEPGIYSVSIFDGTNWGTQKLIVQ